MDIHLLTRHGDQLVVQVVDGRIIVPPSAPVADDELHLQITQAIKKTGSLLLRPSLTR